MTEPALDREVKGSILVPSNVFMTIVVMTNVVAPFFNQNCLSKKLLCDSSLRRNRELKNAFISFGQKKKKSNFDLFLVVVILIFRTSPPIAFAKSLTLDTSSNMGSSRHGIRTRARCALRPLTPLPPPKKTLLS